MLKTTKKEPTPEQKKLTKAVLKYCKTLDIKDEAGVKIGSELENNPQTLLKLYRQPFFLALETDELRLVAKMIFKEQLPYKEWIDKINKEPGALREAVEDYEEMSNSKYQRKSPKGEHW